MLCNNNITKFLPLRDTSYLSFTHKMSIILNTGDNQIKNLKQESFFMKESGSIHHSFIHKWFIKNSYRSPETELQQFYKKKHKQTVYIHYIKKHHEIT